MAGTLATKSEQIAVIPHTMADRSPTPGASTAQADKYRRLIERRHPLYQQKLEHWAFLQETYNGGREWFEKHIFKYIKEGPTEFEERKERAYRFNHTREVVDLTNKYLFRQQINRNTEEAPDFLKKFWTRSTRNGLSITDFCKQVSKQTSILGRIGIVVDSSAPGGNLTVADEKDGEFQAYVYAVPPEQLLDYSYDDAGELNWVLIKEYYREDEDPFSVDDGVQARYRLWTRTDWQLFVERKVSARRNSKVVIELKDSGEHNLGEVPVILADNIITDDEWSSPSTIDDIAYLDRAVANYLSNLDAIIQDQTFSQLAMPAQNVLVGSDEHRQMLEMGTKRVFLYNGETNMAPMYLSPDVKQAELIVQVISKVINEIYHTVGLAGERTKEDNSVGIDNSSGVAKAYDFERVNALLVAKACSLEAIENRIVELVYLWNKKKVDKNLVMYPRDFDTRGLYDEFDIAAKLMLVEAPEEVRRKQMQMLTEKVFPIRTAEEDSKFEKELKSWPPDPVELATTGAPGTGGKPRQGQVTKTTGK